MYVCGISIANTPLFIFPHVVCLLLQVFAWIAVFVLPLNSAINPVLYTLSTKSFLGTARQRVYRFRSSFFTSLTGTTHTGGSTDPKPTDIFPPGKKVWPGAWL